MFYACELQLMAAHGVKAQQLTPAFQWSATGAGVPCGVTRLDSVCSAGSKACTYRNICGIYQHSSQRNNALHTTMDRYV